MPENITPEVKGNRTLLPSILLSGAFVLTFALAYVIISRYVLKGNVRAFFDAEKKFHNLRLFGREDVD